MSTQHAKHCHTCDDCGENLLCPNKDCSKFEQSTKQGTKFSKWLRNLPDYLSGSNFAAQNMDYVWFNWHGFWFITIEEKTNGGKSTDSQIQVHGMVRQMLEFASGHEFDISFGSKKQIKKIQYRGHFLIQFEKTNPHDSQWIKINGKKYNEQILKSLLLTGYLPPES